MIDDPDADVLHELYEAWCAEPDATEASVSPRLLAAFDGYVEAIERPTARHVIDFRADGWTVQHTLACRVRGDLFDCPVNRAAQHLDQPPEQLGRYPVDLDGNRLVVDYAASA